MTCFKKNKEIAEFVTLVLIFICLACVARADVKFEPYSNQFHKVYSLKSPAGKSVKVTTQSGKVSSEIQKRLGLQNRTCNTTASLDTVELELELTGLIDKLKNQDKPRFLTDEQKDILAKVPGCKSYSAELNVIGQLVVGYDLVKVKYL